jgi:hypothetical protein
MFYRLMERIFFGRRGEWMVSLLVGWSTIHKIEEFNAYTSKISSKIPAQKSYKSLRPVQ